MKKLLTILPLLAISVMFLGMAKQPPTGTFQRCIYDVQASAKTAGLKDPWLGGDLNAYKAYTDPLYDACYCKFQNKPYPYSGTVACS